jgi:hypothetical protein
VVAAQRGHEFRRTGGRTTMPAARSAREIPEPHANVERLRLVRHVVEQ